MHSARPLRIFRSSLLAALSVCALSMAAGCTIYRADVQQGNVLVREQVEQLQVGLSQDQVRYLLGTPILTDMFHADRWDYVYTYRKGRERDAEKRKLSLYFDAEGKLAKWEGDTMPVEQPFAKQGSGKTVVDIGDAPPAAAAPEAVPLEEKKTIPTPPTPETAQ